MESVKGEMLPVGTALVDSVLGYAVVFIGLTLLMIVIIAVGKIMVAQAKESARRAKEKLANTRSPEEYERSVNGKQAEAPETPGKPLAPGSAGEVKLYDTDPRDAAMIMAIVADRMQNPLIELRFISIKEVKE